MLSLFKNIIKDIQNKEKRIYEYKILSKQLGVSIKTERQKNLALMGATQEEIDSNISVDAYRFAKFKR